MTPTWILISAGNPTLPFVTSLHFITYLLASVAPCPLVASYSYPSYYRTNSNVPAIDKFPRKFLNNIYSEFLASRI